MAELLLRGNPNYAAKVIEVTTLTELPGLDNLRGVPVDGYLALVHKDTPIGSKMIAFPAETQLAPDFAQANNLYRPNLGFNDDPTVNTGYLEKHARVRALRLRGHVSSALLLSVQTVDEDAEVGTLFDTVDGRELCWKYEPPVKGGAVTAKNKAPKWTRTEKKWLPEHIDTMNAWRFRELIPEDAHVTVTQKLHGSSVRISNTYVHRKLRWFENVAKRLGVKVQETETDYVYGSRKVIKDGSNADSGFYGPGNDIWVREGEKLKGLIPEGVVVYGELIGWVSGEKPIQKGYTYNVPVGKSDLYIYRVAVITEEGGLYDLPWEAVKAFCTGRGLKHVPELWSGRYFDFNPDEWMVDTPYPNAVPLAKESPVEEGVVVRWDGGAQPTVLKAKNPRFFEYESKQLDSGEEVVN